MLSRLIFFNRYYYVAVDLACAPESIADLELETEEERLGCRKTKGSPHHLRNLPDYADAAS